MHWIYDYQLFLFDFDGILVDTEKIHYLAYQQMCANRGFSLNWEMKTYMQHALYGADSLQKGIYKEFPRLKSQEPCWNILYKEKKKPMSNFSSPNKFN
ncbi:MAG: HAD hydrolase-like protein [Chlamydiales bacterium]